VSELVKHNPMAMVPQSLEQAEKVAGLIANSSFAPAPMRGKTGDVLVAIMMGAEVGLSPMQAIQNIAVINGKPSVWGDAALALCKAHPSYEWVSEGVEGVGDKRVAFCKCKRKGEPEVLRTFSVQDAREAGLWGKQGPWKAYPNRMLQMRARGFAIRDTWPDALRGLMTAEEAHDNAAHVPVRSASVPQSQPSAGNTVVVYDVVEPPMTCEQVIQGIVEAESESDLKALINAAMALPPEEVEACRNAYRAKREQLRARDTAPQELPLESSEEQQDDRVPAMGVA
jgi:hypothetical protein